jgi:prepilin-type N-terminal cleavage/methylation domain-containing protein
MKIQRSNKGFTLVEIMIVVVIIGLLAAMAIPAFQKVRTNSLGKTMLNDARQIAGACQQMLLEYNDIQNSTITIDYATTTGLLTCAAHGSAPINEIQKYVQKISKGYVAAQIVYNGAAAAGAQAFTLQNQQLSPRDVAGAGSTVNTGTATAPVQFDTEGKAL